MSTREAATYLDVSERTIFRLLKRNKLRADRFGNYWAFDRESVEAYKQAVEGKSKYDPTKYQQAE